MVVVVVVVGGGWWWLVVVVVVGGGGGVCVHVYARVRACVAYDVCKIFMILRG